MGRCRVIPMTDFGDLQAVPVRQVWPNEARDFTTWLANNISRLGEAIGIDLELLKQECDVGDFSLDILAKDLGNGRFVVIENQYGATNHDHMGKLFTYAAGHDASAAILIAEKIRDEHKAALEWLNRHTDQDTDFFAVTVEVFRIDDSRPAFEFKPIVVPNEWQRRAKAQASQDVSERREKYRRFFQSLLDDLRENRRFTSARVGQPQNWYAFPSSVSGIRYATVFAQGDKARVEAYIDLGDGEKNKALFDRLFGQRSEIERELREKLEWERLDDRRASRIAVYRPGSIEDDDRTLRDIHAWMVAQLLQFRSTLGPRLAREVGVAG
jgi:hypothetical protein